MERPSLAFRFLRIPFLQSGVLEYINRSLVFNPSSSADLNFDHLPINNIRTNIYYPVTVLTSELRDIAVFSHGIFDWSVHHHTGLKQLEIFYTPPPQSPCLPHVDAGPSVLIIYRHAEVYKPDVVLLPNKTEDCSIVNPDIPCFHVHVFPLSAPLTATLTFSPFICSDPRFNGVILPSILLDFSKEKPHWPMSVIPIAFVTELAVWVLVYVIGWILACCSDNHCDPCLFTVRDPPPLPLLLRHKYSSAISTWFSVFSHY